MRYQFLVDTYATEIEKTMSVWAMFSDAHLRVRPHGTDPRGRSLLEQMVHQCVSEDFWFSTMLGISVTDQPLPAEETRAGFLQHYHCLAVARRNALANQTDAWWEETVVFFEMRRTRAWVMVRRIAHTAHHRGQQTTLLRMVNRDVHSTYGPTADTGGLMQHKAPVIYAYPDMSRLLAGMGDGKAPLPVRIERAVTERPDA